MKKRTICGLNRRKIKKLSDCYWIRTSYYPVWGCSAPHIVQQFETVSHAASTPNMKHFFNILAASPTLRKQKNQVLPFYRKMRPQKYIFLRHLVAEKAYKQELTGSIVMVVSDFIVI